ncbi:MAG: UDP-N-acetylglucosamine 2-epimerase (non-hydrolyzing) [Bacteroidetes bacterium]|nr:MAG: UDP-N-acetylglucosamine 2-epimerase (non-hydrolyzing) [Bacteroidota bacterium]
MKKMLIVFGTRPEAIKLCPLILEFKKYPEKFKTVVCVTAQHREMLDQVLEIFSITPDYDLNLMTHNQSLADLTARCISEMDGVIKKVNPDMLIVQGDTTTTFSATLAAYYSKVKIGHVEAGLRTYNKYSPFPEEINRRLSTVISDLHFAPTQTNKNNLIIENIPEKNIIVTGNTVIDALFWVRNNINRENKKYNVFKDIDFSKKIILVTGHRRENFGEGFQNICAALKKIAKNNSNVEIVYPVHLNPNVQKPVNQILAGISNVKLIDPLEYEPFVYLMDKSYFIISDSGGIQEEAPSLGRPVLVTRNTTERPEAVEAGAIKLVGLDKEDIFNAANTLLNESSVYEEMANTKNPYGDGDACKQIIQGLLKFLSECSCRDNLNS